MGRRHPELPGFKEERLLELQQRAEKYFPGAKYVSVYSHTRGKMVIIPLAEAIAGQFGHGIDYGSGVFEGSSAVINELTGEANSLLQPQRLWRLFHRSLPSRGYEAPIDEAQMAQAISDVISANGVDLFRHPDGKTPGYVRAYIRPSVQPASLNSFGITLRKGYPIDVGVVAWAWPDYLSPELAQKGGIAAITGHQRMFPITGKHASNYGAAVVDGMLARSVGADELIYLAPYLIDRDGHRYWHDPNDIEAKLTDGVIADGPGEECIAFLKADPRILVYAPMRVNRLGGTVLQYITDYMAPNLGLTTIEADITLHDLRAGKYAGLAFVGNAVKVTPMRQLNLYNGTTLRQVIELFPEGHIPEAVELIRQRWEAETRGLIPPSHPSLLTPIAI